MITPAHKAAELLWRNRCAGTTISNLPEALRPKDTAAGHAIQAEWPMVSGQAVVGWKIAATSAAGQAHINVGGPLPGRILTRFVFAVGEAVSLAGNRMRVVESEFAFRLGVDLTPLATPRTQKEVLAAVASLHPAFEVPELRYTEFARAGEAQLLADDACCGNFAFGAVAPDGWRAVDLGGACVHASVTDAAGNVRCTRDGDGRAALGDPRHGIMPRLHSRSWQRRSRPCICAICVSARRTWQRIWKLRRSFYNTAASR